MKVYYMMAKWRSSSLHRGITVSTATGLIILLVAEGILSQAISINGLQLQQEQPRKSVSGSDQGILPSDVPTLFSFKVVEHKDGNVSGNFECFALMPDGSTMYVNSTVTDLSLNETSVVMSGPTLITGFGAGSEAFQAVATMSEGREISTAESSDNVTLILTTDVNGDGVQASATDGLERHFNAKIIKGAVPLGS
jgi:hypothetical protein